MTGEQIKQMIIGMAPTFKKAVAEKVDPVAARVALMEKRLEELERSPLEYMGVHEPGRSYSKGSFVTSEGSVWAAMETTIQRPGDSGAWRLAVKKGRDAR